MPVPSRGCLTCRRRHVKCDEKYPICHRCTKAGKQCLGFNKAPNEFAFKDENGYARGLPRRVREAVQGASSREDSGQVSDATGNIGDIATSISGSKSSSGFTERQLQYSYYQPSTSIIRSPHLRIETYAVANFGFKFLDVKHNLPDWHWSHLDQYRKQWESPDSHSVLGVAATALSLAIFCRTRASLVALDISIRKYNEALIRTQGILRDRHRVLEDETLLIVSLLDQYEHIVCELPTERLLSEGFRHEIGTVALLKLRKDQYLSNKSTRLDRSIRGHILQTSILRGIRTPEWFRDHAGFGIEECDMKLDLALLDVAKLRCDLKEFIQRASSVSSSFTKFDPIAAQSLLQEALEVDHALVAWSHTLPEGWTYISHEVGSTAKWNAGVNHDSSFHGGILHVYSGLQQAVYWNQYRGARIIISHIIARILDVQFARLGDSKIRARKLAALSTARSLVNDICAAVPYVFDERNGDPLRPENQDGREDYDQLSARRAVLLVFPLCIAAGSPSTPEHQRKWIQSQLLLISQLSGSRSMEIVGTAGAHASAEYFTPRPVREEGSQGPRLYLTRGF